MVQTWGYFLLVNYFLFLKMQKTNKIQYFHTSFSLVWWNVLYGPNHCDLSHMISYRIPVNIQPTQLYIEEYLVIHTYGNHNKGMKINVTAFLSTKNIWPESTTNAGCTLLNFCCHSSVWSTKSWSVVQCVMVSNSTKLELHVDLTGTTVVEPIHHWKIESHQQKLRNVQRCKTRLSRTARWNGLANKYPGSEIYRKGSSYTQLKNFPNLLAHLPNNKTKHSDSSRKPP